MYLIPSTINLLPLLDLKLNKSSCFDIKQEQNENHDL